MGVSYLCTTKSKIKNVAWNHLGEQNYFVLVYRTNHPHHLENWDYVGEGSMTTVFLQKRVTNTF